MNLKDKIAVVTGASRGIGRAISTSLIGEGAYVYGLARTEDSLAETRTALGERFTALSCDVRDADQVSAAIAQVLEERARIDILVNNAGLGQFGTVQELSLAQWDLQMETNLRGVFLCTRACLSTMKRQNEADGFGGHIVNIASIAGLIGNPRLSAYNASKFGLRGFSEALMKEVREDGIKVTCIYPGSVDTSFADVAGTRGSSNPMTALDIAETVTHILKTADNYLISEVVMRPLRPKG